MAMEMGMAMAMELGMGMAMEVVAADLVRIRCETKREGLRRSSECTSFFFNTPWLSFSSLVVRESVAFY